MASLAMPCRVAVEGVALDGRYSLADVSAPEGEPTTLHLRRLLPRGSMVDVHITTWEEVTITRPSDAPEPAAPAGAPAVYAGPWKTLGDPLPPNVIPLRLTLPAVGIGSMTRG